MRRICHDKTFNRDELTYCAELNYFGTPGFLNTSMAAPRFITAICTRVFSRFFFSLSLLFFPHAENTRQYLSRPFPLLSPTLPPESSFEIHRCVDSAPILKSGYKQL
jgi:hypothetical protein